MHCGLLGRKLGHSYSPQIHRLLGSYTYALYEREEAEVGPFLQSGLWDALNVTIPYKKTVLPYMDVLSDAAKRTGSVNTITRDAEGRLHGDNTDVYGFTALVHHARVEAAGKKALVLGSGGASASVCAALEALGAQVVVISRSGENHYGNLERHKDASLIVNTTPLGMYPNNGEAAVDLRRFPHFEAVLDAIYNPCRPSLLLQAEALGIPCASGLYMLVAQAKRGSELFTGELLPDSVTDRVYWKLYAEQQNIVLVGMPGCGKSTVAGKIAEATGRKLLDSDAEIEARFGASPSQLIQTQGEDAFRRMETAVLAELGKQSGAVLATGGGAVTREENYPLLHQNGVIVWLQRDLHSLDIGDRPLSRQKGVEALYRQREPLYRRFADVTVDLDREDGAASVPEKVSAFLQSQA